MTGWYIVYLLMCGLNGGLMASEGLYPNDIKWWIWLVIPILAYIAGKYGAQG